MVAISTTAEVAMSRIERVDSDLRRWMKVGFIMLRLNVECLGWFNDNGFGCFAVQR